MVNVFFVIVGTYLFTSGIARTQLKHHLQQPPSFWDTFLIAVGLMNVVLNTFLLSGKL